MRASYSIGDFFRTGGRSRSSSRAFTLIELLVVVGLIAVIFMLIVPSVSSMMLGSRVTHSANQIVGALDIARQTAIARNHTIEVRFYKYANPDAPGESVSNPATWKYRAYQFIEYLDNGAALQFSKMEQLPAGVSFDSGTISTLLSTTARQKTFTKEPKIPLPRIDTNYDCAAFRFLPSGNTDLPLPAANWYVTIHREQDGDGLTQPPANYITVQVDSISGSVKLYRPGI
jgi:uncharacterized protein (TIGR02596 family)